MTFRVPFTITGLLGAAITRRITSHTCYSPSPVDTRCTVCQWPFPQDAQVAIMDVYLFEGKPRFMAIDDSGRLAVLEIDEFVCIPVPDEPEPEAPPTLAPRVN